MNEKCPICRQPARVVLKTPTLPFDASVSCGRCGLFIIPDVAMMRQLPEWHLVSAFVREWNDVQKREFNFRNWSIESILNAAPNDKDVDAKSRKLLFALARQSTFPGATFALGGDEMQLCYARNADEFRFLLDGLAARQLVELQSGLNCRITIRGWQTVQEVPNAQSQKAFVAMWFNSAMDNCYAQAIRPAIEGAGYKPTKINDEHFNSSIDDMIIAEIRQSRFIVADVTGHRNGVYYEAGFAMGLGLQVIWLCRDDDIKDMHFDTRQLNHIVWGDNVEVLKQGLSNRILATIGKGTWTPKIE